MTMSMLITMILITTMTITTTTTTTTIKMAIHSLLYQTASILHVIHPDTYYVARALGLGGIVLSILYVTVKVKELRTLTAQARRDESQEQSVRVNSTGCYNVNYKYI
ncbi:hypothetical protein BDQ12DRAFT_439149 [Crucibulum laeve]|uniref:Uncharacterized protein n=1 Tax=Crucibulum laeve TaxID=68775 RepID=A0A5C3M7G8_9AGAR|nr:hypothetical protein BDQ12DRAFT_439149 [Crucibulum laeve]